MCCEQCTRRAIGLRYAQLTKVVLTADQETVAHYAHQLLCTAVLSDVHTRSLHVMHSQSTVACVSEGLAQYQLINTATLRV
jgi:hypothetical protein